MSACDESTRAPDPTFMMALTALVMGALGFFASIVAVVLPFLVPGLRNMDAVSHTARHGRPQHLLTPASPVARPMPASPLASSDSLDVADTNVPPAHVDDALHVSFNSPGPSHAHVPIPIVVPPPLSDTSGASPLSSAETLADASAPSLSPKPSLKTTLSVRLAHAIRRRGSAAAAAPAPTLAATPASPYSASSRRPLFGRRATTLSASDVNEPSGLEQTASEFGEISAGASSGAESGRERGRFGFRALKRTRTVGGGQDSREHAASVPLPPKPSALSVTVESPLPVLAANRMVESPPPISRSPMHSGAVAPPPVVPASAPVAFPGRPFHRRGSSTASSRSQTSPDPHPRTQRRFTSLLMRSPAAPVATPLPESPAVPATPDSAKNKCGKLKGRVHLHGKHKEPARPARTQPYGPPYNVLPPDAGHWGVPVDDEDEDAAAHAEKEKEKEGEREHRRRKRLSAPGGQMSMAMTSRHVRRDSSVPR